MSLRNLSSGRVIGKAMPISYISKCPPLKNDAPSIRWLLIFSSCLVFDVLFSISCSSPSHTIPHRSRPFFLSHNFGLGLLAGVYWFSYDLFRYQCIVRLSIWLNKLVAQNLSLCDYGEGVIRKFVVFTGSHVHMLWKVSQFYSDPFVVAKPSDLRPTFR